MSLFVSTIKQPIKFYESLLSENGYEEYSKAFWEHWEIEKDEGSMIEVHRKEGYVSNGYNIYRDEKITVESDLTARLNKEVVKSKELISEAVKMLDFYDVERISFCNELLTKIQSLLSENYNFIKEFPEIFTQLNSISDYARELANANGLELLSNDEASSSNEKLVEEIFGYLKRDNEGHKIMSDSEHDRLITLITEMLETDKVPEVERKFRDLIISKGILRYTFYVLQQKKYGAVKNDLIIEFMKKAFIAFDEWDITVLKGKFSEPPKTLPDFIPPIIKKQRKKQK